MKTSNTLSWALKYHNVKHSSVSESVLSKPQKCVTESNTGTYDEAIRVSTLTQ